MNPSDPVILPADPLVPLLPAEAPVAPASDPPPYGLASLQALARARGEAAPSSNIARAARMFGDSYPRRRRSWPIWASSLLLIVLMGVYLPWMVTHLAPGRPWLTWPFAGASFLSALCLILSVINGWRSRVTPPRPLEGSRVPAVAVLIPT